MIAEPPVLDGAVHDTVACAAPETPETDVGASGRPMGVVGVDVAAGPVPMRLVAVTLTTYEVPFVRPVMVQPLLTERSVHSTRFHMPIMRRERQSKTTLVILVSYS